MIRNKDLFMYLRLNKQHLVLKVSRLKAGKCREGFKTRKYEVLIVYPESMSIF